MTDLIKVSKFAHHPSYLKNGASIKSGIYYAIMIAWFNIELSENIPVQQYAHAIRPYVNDMDIFLWRKNKWNKH